MDALSPTETQALIQNAVEFVVAAGLGAARALGIMLVLPVFTRPHIGGIIRASATIVIGLPCLMQIRNGLQTLDPGTRMVAVSLLGLKEIFIGLLFGFLLSIPLWSIQAVGDIIDTQRGISSQVDDPATRSQTAAMGLFLGTAAATIFVVSGGLQTMSSLITPEWTSATARRLWFPSGRPSNKSLSTPARRTLPEPDLRGCDVGIAVATTCA